MSNSPQTRFSSVGSRNTVEPLEPYRDRLAAAFVPNTSRNRSTFSTVVVARIMTVLLTSGFVVLQNHIVITRSKSRNCYYVDMDRKRESERRRGYNQYCSAARSLDVIGDR